MVSTLLDVFAYGAFVYGAFAIGGRGVAALVGGVAFLLLSYELSQEDFSLARKVSRVLTREPAPDAPRRGRDRQIITNEVLTERLAPQERSVVDTPDT